MASKKKFEQFQRFKKATVMLKCNYLQTYEEFELFLNLVYDMNPNSKRKYDKKQLLLWAKKKSTELKSRKRKTQFYESWINFE